MLKIMSKRKLEKMMLMIGATALFVWLWALLSIFIMWLMGARW